MMLLRNLCNSYTCPNAKVTKTTSNFCNWHSVMTSTTPFVLESEKVSVVKDILNAFTKAALFGAKCTFKFSNSRYSQVNYFPSISSISLVIQEANYNANHNIQPVNTGRSSINSLLQTSQPSLKAAPTKSLQPQKDTLSLDGSFQTNVSESALLNQSNISNSHIRTLNYKEPLPQLTLLKILLCLPY